MAERIKGTEACPACGRRPRLVNVGHGYHGSWDGSHLVYYVLRCRRLGFRTHHSTQKKGVSTGDPWHRWREDLADEWNALVGKTVLKEKSQL